MCVRVCLRVFHTIATLRFAHTHSRTPIRIGFFLPFLLYLFLIHSLFRSLSLGTVFVLLILLFVWVPMYALSECVILYVLWCYCLVWLIHKHVHTHHRHVHMKAETWQWMVNLIAHCAIQTYICICMCVSKCTYLQCFKPFLMRLKKSFGR